MRSATPTPSTPASRKRVAATFTMRSWLSVLFAREWPIGRSPAHGLDSVDDVRHPQRHIRMMIVIFCSSRLHPKEVAMKVLFQLAIITALLASAVAAPAQGLTEAQARAVIAPWYSLFNQPVQGDMKTLQEQV